MLPIGHHATPAAANLRSIDLNDITTPQPSDGPIQLSAARNEWTSFQLQLSSLPPNTDKNICVLRFQPLNLQSGGGTVAASCFSVYQILKMPVDVNRAGYVRHTGLSAATRQLPRALLPLTIDNNTVNLTTLRDPDRPTDPSATAGSKTTLLWVDLHLPPDATPGNYSTRVDVLQTGDDRPIASVTFNLNVYDFVLPEERHLSLIGQVDWESLVRLYSKQFEALSPRLVSRSDDRCLQAVRTMDGLEKLAQEHRVELTIPRLQPSVKWPGGKPPAVSWDDFDSLVGPWLRGDMFADKIPLNYWPLPACDGLSNFDPHSQRDYWSNASTHFDQNDWLTHSPIFMETASRKRATELEALKLSADASNLLAANPRVNVVLPLEDDQLQLSSAGNPNLIKTEDTSRLITTNPGVVFAPPAASWPAGAKRPARWLSTLPTGLIPYVGAGGDERDVRLWAWLSFLPLPPPQMGVQYGPVQFIRFLNALPTNSSPNEPADPNELIWCYPGSWFGVDQPLPTVQLKWLRRAQQDYEYLYLARQRGDLINALYMARLMTKPVELSPQQQPDPTFGLMCGTADPSAWSQAIDLLAQRILLNRPGQSAEHVNDTEYKQADHTLNIHMLQWSVPQERPVIAGRTTEWGWERRADTGQQIDLRLGVDIYNASDSRPEANTLAWTAEPANAGWQVRPQPVQIPSLNTYQVKRVAIDGNIDPARLGRPTRQPVEVTFTNGYNQQPSHVRMVIPICASSRRETMLDITDGSLDDWSEDDAIQNGPMTKMLSRPALQAQRAEEASTDSHVYTSWADENFYLAFKVGGLSHDPTRTVRNFLTYQFRRAWGEDLCQVIIQPIYADNSVGPVLHLALKPNGSWVERKLDPRTHADPWVPLEGAGVRYAATFQGDDWRGEVAIPWKAISDQKKELPVMLRFNFIQHRAATGESASWAGPIDFGRDDDFTGVLVLKEPETPGVVH